MSSLSVALPLRIDSTDGFKMNKSLKSLVKQNLKMLLLTVPGERIMDPDFGVGVRRYLFEGFNQTVYAEIDVRIREQVKRYLPVIKIRRIAFDDTEQDFNKLYFSITYTVPNIGIKDLLEFTI
jgi:phage baseplate assembly protein W